MPLRPHRPRRLTVREVLEIAIELEKKTMALYVGLVQAFPRPEEVRNFWFHMARHEAGHYGALTLVECIIEGDPSRGAAARIWFDEGTVTRLRALLAAYLREIRGGGVTLARAFEMALDIEGSELEDVVLDTLSVVRSPRWRERAVQLLLHDLGDLSYMIEKYAGDERLLRRADAMLERRIGAHRPPGAPARGRRERGRAPAVSLVRGRDAP